MDVRTKGLLVSYSFLNVVVFIGVVFLWSSLGTADFRIKTWKSFCILKYPLFSACKISWVTVFCFRIWTKLSKSKPLICLHMEGFRPEWCISTIFHASDTPFWSGILDICVFTSTFSEWFRTFHPRGMCLDWVYLKIILCLLLLVYALVYHHLIGLVGNASASRAADTGVDSSFLCGDFPGWVIPVT